MQKYKKISRKGGLTIPADIRREINAFHPGDPVEIETQNGKLVITPHTPTCIFCRSVHEVVNFMGKHVCKKCIKDLVDAGGL